ncbi:MAG: hypothetical protein IIB00_08250, partial [candidate division Zixibacteria bacterium]|nr:hypothetical protein [candidate division Zixibacteria bacterium]
MENKSQQKRSLPVRFMLSLGIVLCLVVNVEAYEALDSTRFIVGPGDAFSVSFFDAAVAKIEFEVSIEGKVTIPTV